MSQAIADLEPSSQSETKPPQSVADRGTSYREILKATFLIGGSQVVNVLISMVRAKVMAILLGPAGVGLNGMYGSVLSLAQTVAGLGINSSGVRQVAESLGTGDRNRVARTVTVLRQVSLLLGLLGGAALVLGSAPIAQLTFGRVNQGETVGIALLSIVLFINLVMAGQGALLQGLRKIREMALANILGSLAGTVTVIPLVYYWGTDGIVPGLIAGSAAMFVVNWWFVRQIAISKPAMDWAEMTEEAGALAKLGFAFMISGLMVMVSGYAIRLIVIRFAGLESTGLYHAAWTVGGMYVTLVLQSMGADFYPRLTQEIRNHAASVRLVNEQTSVSLLLAGPGILATLLFAPLGLTLLYSSKFVAATELMRWICLGVALRVVSWPLGFVLMAEGNQRRIIAVEVAWTAVHLGLAWLLVPIWGLAGAGIAFFGSYVFHIAITYLLARRTIGFRWSSANLQIMAAQTFAVLGAFVLARFVDGWISYAAWTLVLLGAGALSLRELTKITGIPERFRPWMTRATAMFGR